MERLKKWISMIPSQFQNKILIEAYIRALSRQLDEVEKMLLELDKLTDVVSAEGKQLDQIGDIVVMSRKEAAYLMDDNSIHYLMEDDTYRRFLKYKILRNTNCCTYDDLMDGLELVWNTDRIRYAEEEAYPATIIFSTEIMSLDDKDIVFHRNLCIKASGVLLLLRKLFFEAYVIDLDAIAKLLIRCEIYARNNRVPLYLDGSWLLNGMYSLSGYKESTGIDFYPVIMSNTAYCKVPMLLTARKKFCTIIYTEKFADSRYICKSYIAKELLINHVVLAGSNALVSYEIAELFHVGGAIKEEYDIHSRQSARDFITVHVNQPYAVIKPVSKLDVITCWSTKQEMQIEIKEEAESSGKINVGSRVSVEGVAETKSGFVIGVNSKISTNSQLRVEKRLWYLDGTHVLDGSLLLNAAIINYEL